jgi:hypothetical protein
MNFKNIDLTKLEVKFVQAGCFNFDRFKMTFKKNQNEYYINLYGYSTNDYEKIKLHPENTDKLIISRVIKPYELNQIKDILIIDNTAISTMLNLIIINYNGTIYKFNDAHYNPEWKKYIYTILNKINNHS